MINSITTLLILSLLLLGSCATTPYSSNGRVPKVIDSKCEKLIQRNYIETCFSYIHQQGKWSFYKLKFSKLTHTLKRSGHFKKDPFLKENPDEADYKYSGYDKGHLANSKDFSFDVRAMEDTFYLSNIAPQDRFQNQRGVWKKLEDKIRKDSEANDREYYILTGTKLNEEHLKKIKSNSLISIPKYFFKFIMWLSPNGHYELKAYKIPNSETTDTEPAHFEVSPKALEEELEISIAL